MNKGKVIKIVGGDCSSDRYTVHAQVDSFSNRGKGSQTPAVRFYGDADVRGNDISDFSYCFSATFDELIKKFTELGFDITLRSNVVLAEEPDDPGPIAPVRDIEDAKSAAERDDRDLGGHVSPDYSDDPGAYPSAPGEGPHEPPFTEPGHGGEAA
jgi:hypothetical protein